MDGPWHARFSARPDAAAAEKPFVSAMHRKLCSIFPLAMADQQTESRKWPWIFSALEVGDSLALGAEARLEVSPRTTVLVGRNGAGKSALLEKILAGARGATGIVNDEEIDPGFFVCELSHTNAPNVVVRYECRWHSSDKGEQSNALSEEDEERKEPRRCAEVEERCLILQGGGRELLWEVKDGLLRRNDGTTDKLPVERSLLNWRIASRKGFVFNKMVDPLFDLLWFPAIPVIQAGVPRAGKGRDVAILPYPWPYATATRSRLTRQYSHISTGIRRLTLQLAGWFEKEPARMDEFKGIGRRLQLFNQIEVSLFSNPEHTADPRAPRQLAGVSIDGVNLGLLSDGTLRVMEIIAELIAPDVSLLLIEEPEIAVHPGLLGRLLNEIDAYTTDRQVILSTQSPQVVNWARPDSLRLVERAEGKTHIRSLNEVERARIERYLSDEGTLGDYIYADGIDIDG